jgi:hypothetical protein
LSDSAYNERDLVQRCQQGDLKAYQVLYNQFDQPLLRLGHRILGQQQDAEEIQLETNDDILLKKQ